MYKIQVLMSTFNGEKYLKQQIESILRQTDVKVSLLVRDDGSLDSTKRIINDYAENYKNFECYMGENIGSTKSFFDLLKHADKDFDYFAFSDQDDIWIHNKLINAMEHLESTADQSIPLLYASTVICTSEDLTNKKNPIFQNLLNPMLGNALVENICMGCTEVFNRSLLNLVSECTPDSFVWHDWWLYLVASCFGVVVYDQDSYIMYRQHGGNQVGIQQSYTSKWKKRMGHFSELKGYISNQAQEFQRIYGTEYENYTLVRLMAEHKSSFKNRLSLVVNKKIYRQQMLDNFIFHILFLLGVL